VVRPHVSHFGIGVMSLKRCLLIRIEVSLTCSGISTGCVYIGPLVRLRLFLTRARSMVYWDFVFCAVCKWKWSFSRVARSVRRTLVSPGVSELTGERVLSSPWVVRRSNRWCSCVIYRWCRLAQFSGWIVVQLLYRFMILMCLQYTEYLLVQ